MKQRALILGLGALIAVTLAFNLWIVVSGNTYLYPTLIHQGVGIDDWKIFQNREVATGKAQPWPLSDRYNRKQLSASRKAFIRDEMETVALLLVRNGALEFEEYWEDYGPDSLSSSFSIAKSIVSILIGIAIDEGRLEGVEQRLGEILPEYADTDKAKLRIVDLLTMSSGLDYHEVRKDPLADSAESYYTSDLTAQTRRIRRIFGPGKVFRYQNVNPLYLAQILQKVTGMTVSDYASQKLWKPLGAEKRALWSVDREGGLEKAYCCFSSNARDFARLGQLFLNRGSWKGRQIVSEPYVTASVTPAPLVDERGKPFRRYGYAWWLMEYREHSIFKARGSLGQFVIVIPEKNAVLVRLGRKGFSRHGPRYLEDSRFYIDTALELMQ